MFTANKFQFLGMITREYLAQILPETTVDNINNLFYIYIYMRIYIYAYIYIISTILPQQLTDIFLIVSVLQLTLSILENKHID